MTPTCPYCGNLDTVYAKTGKCQYSYPKESVHKNSGWNTKSIPSKPYTSPIRDITDELREADDLKLQEINKRKAQEALNRIRKELQDVLTDEQFDRIAVIRKDDPVLGIPASIFFVILERHAELIEELRQIIDGLS